MDAAKVKTRPSYLNAILIQSRGCTGITYTSYVQNLNRGPFVDYRRVKGYFTGACGNCKWRDHAARCSVSAPGEESDNKVLVIEGRQERKAEEVEEVGEAKKIEYIVISDSE